jgi:uncharacterized protein
MRLYTIVLIALILTVILPDIFFFLKLKKHKVKWPLHILNFLPSLFFISAFLVMKFSGSNMPDPNRFHVFMWINFAFMLLYVPKLIYVIFHFLNYLLNLLLKEKIYLLRYAGAIVAMFVVVLFAHGAFVNPKNVQLRKTTIEVEDLPAAFDGYTIVQISDIHLGSWGKNHNYLKPAIKIINEQNADILVFTGDMVHNYHEETEGWAPLFNEIRVKEGKYAVLGNHDYGDYSEWNSEDEKAENLAKIKQAFSDFGFSLLLNEKVDLVRNTDSIELMGVENWGKPPFPKYGDLNKAISQTDSARLKILLTHDPSHWKAEVIGKENIFLTLSGHTHAAQMAFNLYGKLRSPSAWVYQEWDGLYEQQGQFLFINRGLGFVGIPVRLGAARPEVTLITLKSK